MTREFVCCDDTQDGPKRLLIVCDDESTEDRHVSVYRFGDQKITIDRAHGADVKITHTADVRVYGEEPLPEFVPDGVDPFDV